MCAFPVTQRPATFEERGRGVAAFEGDVAVVELIAPHIGGAVLGDGSLLPVHQKIDGAPSVLYDAVAILASADGAALLAADATAKDFVSDAHAHGKFIAYHPDAQVLLEAAGVAAHLDEGYTALAKRTAAADFVESCRGVRYWARTHAVEQT